MSSRPDAELVLDVRSYERVVVIARRDTVHTYPMAWYRPSSLSEMLTLLGPDSVVVIDGADVTRRTLGSIGERSPRLVALTATGEEHARAARKLLLSVQPWCDLYAANSSLGRLVVAHRFSGRPYERERVIDMRSGARA